MTDMDLAIDAIIGAAQLHSGQPAGWLQAKNEAIRPAMGRFGGRMPVWTEEEIAYVRDHTGEMSYADIAAALGRSEQAVHIVVVRRGLPAARKQPGWLTGNQVCHLLGLESHSVPAWIDNGILPGEYLPFDKVERRVKWDVLKRWITRPEHWPYLKVDRIRSAHLRRLVCLAQERWGDEWWTSRQVADFHHTDPKHIEQMRRRGLITGAIRCPFIGGRHADTWAYWFYRKSVVLKLRIYHGKGRAHAYNWPAEADEFLMRCRAEGKPHKQIARMMNWTHKRVAFRFSTLVKLGRYSPERYQAMIYRKDFDGDIGGSELNRVSAIVKATVGADSIETQQMGVRMLVKTTDETAEKVLTALGFSAEVMAPVVSHKTRLSKKAELSSAGLGFPKGRYKKDGISEIINSSTLFKQLNQKAYGTGVQFQNVATKIWYEVVELEGGGYSLAERES